MIDQLNNPLNEAGHGSPDTTPPLPSVEAPEAAGGRSPADRPSAASRSVGAMADAAAQADDDAPPPGVKDWYIVKVQSNREESIREALLRRVAIEGLGEFFGECIVPVEMRSEFRNGKKRVFKAKLWPGYLVVHMEINDHTWHLVRSTPGIGDFVGGAGKPSPLAPHDVAKILAKQDEKLDEAPKLKIAFKQGDRVKIIEGTFENFEGEVDAIDIPNGRVTVMINIFGRSTPVELEYWQIEAV